MRTTLDIEEDVLLYLKERAARSGQSTGRVVSEIVREMLNQPRAGCTRNGVPLFTPVDENTIVTMEMVNELRDEAP
jgi:hypothetical protein